MIERIFMQVNLAKREAEITLDNKDYDERLTNYQRKKWIENGLDPDVEEQNLKKQKDREEKERKKANKLRYEEQKKNSAELQTGDERFKNFQATKRPSTNDKKNTNKKVKTK